ncbi:hypothetical protein GIB67_019739 [Kingdonia uniflora]|uniref:RRM domain-containing protein n=1 Tax=Kingdonia uniflora TaxID=39325 RepID=A0A7J7MK03_9MAGN|nr:hypothetical protein GIB67_019739 [Kingdonia uniflora]
MTTRIFVGGLGGSVTEEDLEKTFSSLGIVKGVEIVNGRNFSYIDFQPSSHNSISKLFSMYNGCIWKGGRLKLEKAKEHYLVRLRREWAENAKPAKIPNDDLVGDKSVAVKEKSKLLTSEMQLQIFFPKLRKVKSVPYNGTGKHKYSFQRIDVPSLPIHYCDCEEHCNPLETVKKKQACSIQDQTDTLDEDELNMMQSVLSKLLKKEDNIASAYSRTNFLTEDSNPNQSIDDIPFEESEADEEADVDNLVINIVNRRSKSGLVESQGWGTISALNQEMKSSKPQLSNDGLSQNKLKSQKRKVIASINSPDPTSKNSQLLPSHQSNKEELTSKPKKKVKWETCAEESKGSLIEEAWPTDEKVGAHQSTTGPIWKQKTSWKKLLSETANSSFSISHIFPDNVREQNLPKTDSFGTEGFSHGRDNIARQPLSCESTVKNSEALLVSKDEVLQEKVTELCSSIVEAPSSSELQGPKFPSTDQKESRGQSWLHKSSWRELVGEMGNTSFSFSHILPGNVSATRDLPSSLAIENFNNSKQKNLTKPLRNDTTEVDLKDVGVGKDRILQQKATSALAATIMLSSVEGGATSPGLEKDELSENKLQEEKDELSENKDCGPDQNVAKVACINEFCTFMRSAASEREWTRTKAALSGSLKKKK